MDCLLVCVWIVPTKITALTRLQYHFNILNDHQVPSSIVSYYIRNLVQHQFPKSNFISFLGLFNICITIADILIIKFISKSKVCFFYCLET